jgi:hypothetical protein
MAINYRVAADVVDIRTDKPRTGDVFLVDTNVWFWMSYTKVPPDVPQAKFYPPFVSNARKTGARLLRCGLSFAELSHLIERAEREIYEAANPALRPSGWRNPTGWVKAKEFRHNLSAERVAVVAEVNAAWGMVRTMADPLDVTVDDPTTMAAMGRLATQLLDGYDLFIVEAVVKAGMVQVLTDDGDFCTVPALCVFTANQNVINAAASQGKPLKR